MSLRVKLTGVSLLKLEKYVLILEIFDTILWHSMDNTPVMFYKNAWHFCTTKPFQRLINKPGPALWNILSSLQSNTTGFFLFFIK